MSDKIIIPKYTMDLDSFVKIFRDEGAYTKKHFRTLSDKVSNLLIGGIIISHIEVFKEIEDGYKESGRKDELYEWAKSNKNIFKDYNLPDETFKIKEVGDKFPMFTYQNKEKPNHADPWLVAQAMINNLTLITEEKKMGNSGIPKICIDFKVRYIDLFGLIKENGWVM